MVYGHDSDSSEEDHEYVSSIPRLDLGMLSPQGYESAIPNIMANSSTQTPRVESTIQEDAGTNEFPSLNTNLPSFKINLTSPTDSNDGVNIYMGNPPMDAGDSSTTAIDNFMSGEQTFKGGKEELNAPQPANQYPNSILKPPASAKAQSAVDFDDSDSSTDNELDVTDFPNNNSNNSRHDSDDSAKHESTNDNESTQSSHENFRDKIRRKMSISASKPTNMEEPNQNDGFLSRILNFSSFANSGMAPGAAKYEPHTNKKSDEENRIGLTKSNSRDIELDNLDFNKEAQGLISSHLPDFHHHFSPKVSFSHSGSHRNSINPEAEHDQNVGSSSDQRRASTLDSLISPNPNFLRSNPGEFDDLALDEHGDYIAPPKNVQAGVLSSLLKLYQNPMSGKSSTTLFSEDRESSDQSSLGSLKRPESTVDFTKWSKLKKFKSKSGRESFISSDEESSFGGGHLSPGRGHKRITSSSSIAGLLSHNKVRGDTQSDLPFQKHKYSASVTNLPSFTNAKPKVPKKQTTHNYITPKLNKKKRLEHQARITVHIADILQRQRFILRMCKALMLYGAPTHRLEEYMVMTSRVLEIDGQFIYLPGCMIASFGDAATRTSEVTIVRCNQGLNLSKLHDTHKIYKSVVHDLVGVEEASAQLEQLLARKIIYPPWVCVFFYGFGSAMVCPFAFGGGWLDMPVTFGVGLCVGFLQFYVSSMSNLYSSVFEVTSSIVVSFIARAIGSINDSNTFCFSAIAQGSLALILPGYIILCGSLELQSRNIVAGSVRMFYAIIYSLFLSFGITLGAALYGWIDHNATNQTTCEANHNVDAKYRILFIPAYSIILGLINQARLSQLPVMVIISSIGYVANYYAGKHFKEVSEFTSAIGCFVIGLLGNLYSRVGKGMAVAAMLPAIFVQVPSGIASQASLLSGISSANLITHNDNSSSTSTTTSSTSSDGSALSFGATMVEVSIGISVGLFAATLIVYPLGKKRTGLFTL